jgi:hypothetical protein
MALATIEQLESYLGTVITGPSAVASATLALDIASDAVEKYIGYSILEVEDDVITVDGTANFVFLLPAYPVTEITAIVEDGILLDTDKYEYSQFGIVKRSFGVWTNKLSGISVTYTHGFTDVPLSIVGVVLALAGRIKDGSSNIKQESIGGYSVTYANPSPVLQAAEVMTLDAFRILK